MTHRFAIMRDPGLTPYLTAFDEWTIDAVTRGDIDALRDFRHKAPGVDIAHPTADHFVPLLVSLGASDDPQSAISTIDRMDLGNSISSRQIA